MIVFVALLFILTLYKCKPLFNSSFHTDYASIGQSRSINGIFIMLILLSHTFAKVTPDGVFDEVYQPLKIFLEQFVLMSYDWKIESNNGYTFSSGYWASVKNNMWDKSNWTFYEGKKVLKEHSAN